MFSFKFVHEKLLLNFNWTLCNGENTSRVFSGSDFLKYVKVALSQKKLWLHLPKKSAKSQCINTELLH